MDWKHWQDKERIIYKYEKLDETVECKCQETKQAPIMKIFEFVAVASWLINDRSMMNVDIPFAQRLLIICPQIKQCLIIQYLCQRPS